jgi:hypothetical protein
LNEAIAAAFNRSASAVTTIAWGCVAIVALFCGLVGCVGYDPVTARSESAVGVAAISFSIVSVIALFSLFQLGGAISAHRITATGKEEREKGEQREIKKKSSHWVLPWKEEIINRRLFWHKAHAETYNQPSSSSTPQTSDKNTAKNKRTILPGQEGADFDIQPPSN